jgi:hypothetical protein
VRQYDPKAAIDSWPQQAKSSVVFGLQYGLKDDLAPPTLSQNLVKELKEDGLSLQVRSNLQVLAVAERWRFADSADAMAQLLTANKPAFLHGWRA